jgi:hypothetical protein
MDCIATGEPSALVRLIGYAQSGYLVVTTSPQLVMVQAVLPLLKHELPVFDGEDLYDRTARATMRGDDYPMIDELNRKLFLVLV